MKIVNIHQAKTHFSKLVEQVLQGEEVVIAKSNKPVVKLVPYETSFEPRVPGRLKGKIWMADDADMQKADADIERMFYGEDE